MAWGGVERGGVGAVLWAGSVAVTLSLLADYVYFENSSSNPYLIRRIEELNKVACAHVCCVCCVSTLVHMRVWE